MMRQAQQARRVSRIALVLVAAVLIGAAPVRASDSPIELGGPLSPYAVQLQALTGPAGTDLTMRVADPTSSAEPPAALSHVLVTTTRGDESVDVQHFKNVASPGGVATLHLDRVPRGETVAARLLFKTGEWQRTFVLYAFTRSLLRPDLVVDTITVPQQLLVGSAVKVTAVVAERNGDVGADAVVSLSVLPGSAEHVVVPKNGTATVTFPDVTLKEPVPVGLHVTVADATPGETDATNNTTTTMVEVTRNQLATPRVVLFPSLLGYGAQLNNHVYAPITPWPSGLEYADVEDKVKALEPQLVRIFYNDNWDGNWTTGFWTPTWQENYASFVDVVRLAQAAGATIDISFQNLANAKLAPEASMAKFADVLEELVRTEHLTNVRWAEAGNEPNYAEPGVTLADYENITRALHAQLVQRGLHDQIRIMGGGLVERSLGGGKSHYEWLKTIGDNMSDVVDAYAEHVYWWYDNPGRLDYRVRDTYNLAAKVLPADRQKPLYLMEFGVRGYNTCPGKPAMPSGDHLYYRDANCTEIWRTNIAGFQQLWFNIASAQYGVAGTSKWDAYWGMYDRSSPNNQVYWMIGPATEGSPLTPTYYAMSLLFHTTAPGWQIVRLEPWNDDDWDVAKDADGKSRWDWAGGSVTADQREQELAAYAGPGGELTVVGLDTNGRFLNVVSDQPAEPYSIGGLPANTAFTLAVWDATGDGTNSIAGTVVTNAAGVARFEVPLQAAFALTTVPVS